jgi:hypothetical protein
VWKTKPLRLIFQVINYSVFMGIVGYLSILPSHRHLEENQAVVTLAFGHAGQRVSECVRLTPEQLAEMAPNMRKPAECPRERSPLTVELRLDDAVLAREVIEAPGLYNDQSVDVYRNFEVPAGSHRLSIEMNDDVNVDGPTWQHRQTVSLRPAQRVVVAFEPERGGFSID